MTCESTKLPGTSGIAIVCSRTRKLTCACRARAVKLCDFPDRSRKSGTCDEPLCRNCARPAGRDKDYCGKHAKAVTR